MLNATDISPEEGRYQKKSDARADAYGGLPSHAKIRPVVRLWLGTLKHG